MMMRRMSGWLITGGLILTLITGLASAGLAAEESKEPRVSLQLEEATLKKAIEMLQRSVKFEYFIDLQGRPEPVIPSLTVIDRYWEDALKLIVEAANLTMVVEEGVYKIRPKPAPVGPGGPGGAGAAPPAPPPPPKRPPARAQRAPKREKEEKDEQAVEAQMGKPKPQVIPVKHLDAGMVAYLLGGQALYQWQFNPMGSMGGGYGNSGYGNSGYGGSSYGGSSFGSGSSFGGGGSFGSSGGFGGGSFGSSGGFGGGSSFGGGGGSSSWR